MKLPLLIEWAQPNALNIGEEREEISIGNKAKEFVQSFGYYYKETNDYLVLNDMVIDKEEAAIVYFTT